MGRPRKVQAEGSEDGAGDAPEGVVRFKFKAMWSSDRGVFLPGQEADLPEGIAESLRDEEVGEIV